MKKYFIALYVLFFVCVNAQAAQIYYDPWVSPLGERTGSVWLNGEKYKVKETETPWGATKMEIKNFDNTYKGTIDPITNSGTLRDWNGNEIKVNSYRY